MRRKSNKRRKMINLSHIHLIIKGNVLEEKRIVAVSRAGLRGGEAAGNRQTVGQKHTPCQLVKNTQVTTSQSNGFVSINRTAERTKCINQRLVQRVIYSPYSKCCISVNGVLELKFNYNMLVLLKYTGTVPNHQT